MTKSELKTGMILVFTSGEMATVLLDTLHGDVFAGDTWGPLDNFDENLVEWNTSLKIACVRQPNSNMGFCNNIDSSVIWENPKIKNP